MQVDGKREDKKKNLSLGVGFGEVV